MDENAQLAPPRRGQVLARFPYPEYRVERGYSNQTLHVDLSSNTIEARPVTPKMKENFIGGRGFGLWLLWNSVRDDTKWNDPENAVVISSGPLGGTIQFPGSGKSLVVTLSPATGVPIDSNVGGHFGPLLKFAGWDAIELRGKALDDVFVVVDGDERVVTIERAFEGPSDSYVVMSGIYDLFALDEMDKPNVSAVTSGPGAEHTFMGCLNFSFWDRRRQTFRLKQAGRGGTGTVLRNKKVKGLIVRKSGWKPRWTIVDPPPSVTGEAGVPVTHVPRDAMPEVIAEPSAPVPAKKKKPAKKKAAQKKAPARKKPAKKKAAKKKAPARKKPAKKKAAKKKAPARKKPAKKKAAKKKAPARKKPAKRKVAKKKAPARKKPAKKKVAKKKAPARKKPAKKKAAKKKAPARKKPAKKKAAKKKAPVRKKPAKRKAVKRKAPAKKK